MTRLARFNSGVNNFGFARKSVAAAVSAVYVEDVLQTYLYTGTALASSGQYASAAPRTLTTNFNLFTQSGESTYLTAGSYSFVVPDGVTSISAVCVGAGGNASGDAGTGNSGAGGGGGALSYGNNISVTPGETLSVVVGAAGGNSSTLSRGGTVLLSGGGGGNTNNTTPGNGGTSGGTARTGGGNGGPGASGRGGGGGAGGYSGTGGTGGAAGTTDSGGGGAQGAAGSSGGGGGGGVSVLAGTGPAGAAGASENKGGGGGSFGTNGTDGTGGYGGSGGFPGGGGGGGYTASGGNGASGAVRIIWPGDSRSFPSTSVSRSNSSNGGLVWLKARNQSYNHIWIDTVRGSHKSLISNSTAGEVAGGNYITGFNSDGFDMAPSTVINSDSVTHVAYQLKRQAKFFDIVTYTGNGANRTISHNLGSVPGCIIVKRTDTATNWYVYHRSTGNNSTLYLDTTDTLFTTPTFWNATTPTSSSFSLGTGSTNTNGGTYVAYLFAHDEAAFGENNNESIVYCGTYTGDGNTEGPQVTIGWEPGWLLIKNTSSVTSADWFLFDEMRGLSGYNTFDRDIRPNITQAEENAASYVNTNQTGFTTGSATALNQNGVTYVFIAIRKGPMKTPTTATSVFTPAVGASTTPGFSTTNKADVALVGWKAGNSSYPTIASRLLPPNYITTTGTAVENSNSSWVWTFNTGFGSSAFATNGAGAFFTRAPKFCDVVLYTGTRTLRTVSHNLKVVPELMIVRNRDNAGGRDFYVYYGQQDKFLLLNSTNGTATSTTAWGNTLPTSSVFSLGDNAFTNESASGSRHIAYLFASLAGISKISTYTGTGTTLQIDCGFTGGARFVLIKRVDSTGDWYWWDTARGIIAGNDPYILVNSASAAEVTNTDYIDSYANGFEISSTAPVAINASGGTFLYFAVA